MAKPDSAVMDEVVVYGDFVLRQQIGEGGFGTVYLAEQRSLDRTAVVKVMRRSLAARPDAVERFVLEARLASKLDHPSAAHIYAFGAEPDGTLWIAMELVKGTPLDVLLDAGPLPLERVVPMLERLCEALQTAHDQGIVHRDIKPANVMVAAKSGRLVPKLLDFGIAKQIVATEYAVEEMPACTREIAPRPISGLEHTLASTNEQQSTAAGTTSLTQAGQILGSPPYMAPEQWTDPALVGPRTDQYALALLAFEALTAERACIGKTLAALAEEHLEAPLRTAAAIPPAVHAVLARAAAKDPKDRFPDLDTFAVALRTAAGLTPDTERVFAGLAAELQTAWTTDAPQPIAQTIAALAQARTPTRFGDGAAAVGQVIARWLATLALASKVRGTKQADAIRDLRRRQPREDDWIELAVALAKEHERVETCPIPELATWCRDDSAVDVLRRLVRVRTLGDGDVSELEHATRQRTALEAALASLAWLLDYEVGREVATGIELWSGTLTDDRIVRRTASSGDRVVVCDADGARVVALSPLVQIAKPMASEPEQMFVFAGPSRRGTVQHVALPRGYERDDLADWPQLADYLLDGDVDSTRATADERSPYPGLASFTTRDHESFVGREREISELVNRLRGNPVVTVIGPSGAGKSSFLAAGVVPALPGGWQATTIRPGRDPVAVLASVCERVDGTPYRDAAIDAASSTSIAARLVTWAERSAHVRVLVIDQAEELFTQGVTEAQRAAFAEAIVALASCERARVVIGIRDDFLCRIEELPWRGAVATCVQILGVPGRDELERIVSEPARRRGHDFEDPQLPARMVEEVIDRPGALPLLAFAAAELWERRDRHFHRLTNAAYAEIGGVTGALVKHADGVVDDFTVADRKLVRLAFRRLLTVEGARVVHGRAELVASLGGGAAAERVVERLLAARLVVSRDDDAGERIEIIHEALTRTWPRLDQWRREDETGAKLHEQLAAAAKHWAERARPDGLLWRDAALDELRRWRAAHPVGLSPIEIAFADTSEATARRARRRKLIAVSSAFTVLGAAVVVLGVLSHRISTQRADAVRRVAAGFEERGRIAIEGGDNLAALLYLAEAAKLGERGLAHDFLVGRAAAAVDAFERVEVRVPDSILGAEFLSDGFLTVHHGKVQRWNRAGQVVLTMSDILLGTAVGDGITALMPDGSVTHTNAAGTVVWRSAPSAITAQPGIVVSDAQDLVATFHGPDLEVLTADGTQRALLHHDSWVQAAKFDATGHRIAVTSGGELRVWDLATSSVIATCTTTAKRLPGLVFLGAGDRIAISGDDGVVRVCSASTGEVVYTLSGHLNVAPRLAATDDVLVSSSLDGTARLWNLKTGQPIGVLVGHRGGVSHIRLSPDGRYLATGGEDGTVRIWDVASAKQLGSLEGHVAQNAGIAWRTPEQIETASFDGTIRSWSVPRAIRHAITQAHQGPVDRLDITADGSEVLTYGRDHASFVWELAGWTRHAAAPEAQLAAAAMVPSKHVVAATIDGHALLDGHPLAGSEHVALIAASDDGRIVATAAESTITLQTATGQKVAAAAVAFTPTEILFDPSGARLVVVDGRSKHGVIVLDTRDLHELAHLADGLVVTTTEIDEQRLVVKMEREVRVYDLGTWNLHTTLVQGSRTTDLALVSDGRIVTTDIAARINVWDRDGHVLARLPSGRATSLDASADGRLLAVGTNEGTLEIWDLVGYRKLVSLRAHRSAVYAVELAPDGTRAVTAGLDGQVARWDLARSTRSAAELAKLVKCRVPLQLAGDALQPREIDFDDPACSR